jgi:Flp pilus assembly CpaE family ATPase
LILLLLQPDEAMLRTAEASLVAIKQLSKQPLQIWPILNKVQSGHRSLRHQVEGILGLPLMATLPWSPEACSRAEKKQLPVVVDSPGSSLTLDIQGLAWEVMQAARGQKGTTV